MSFNVRNPAIEQLQRKLADQVREQLPEGWGLALFLFPFEDPEGTCFYISTAQRPTIVEMLKAWIKRQVS